MSKRGDRVAPPPPPGGWKLRYATKQAVDGWEDLCAVASNATLKAYEVLSNRPEIPDNPDRQHRLRGEIATKMVNGKNLAQWQYEVTSGGRIFYCPDPDARTVWLVEVSPGHPKRTE